MSNWVSHFKSILNTKDKIDIPGISDSVGPLDFQFTMEELAAVTVIFKAGKCPGLDNITNEMILLIVIPALYYYFSIKYFPQGV